MSVSYFTVPPRAHPSTGSQSGSAAPVLTQVPSTRSRGPLNCRDDSAGYLSSCAQSPPQRRAHVLGTRCTLHVPRTTYRILNHLAGSPRAQHPDLPGSSVITWLDLRVHDRTPPTRRRRASSPSSARPASLPPPPAPSPCRLTHPTDTHADTPSLCCSCHPSASRAAIDATCN